MPVPSLIRFRPPSLHACPLGDTGESFYLRVYGKLNHNLRCTLRGYRNLMGDFTGNTIYTGFK